MISINWENRTRQELLQHLVNKNGYTDYLEIGCDKNQVFGVISVENKTGVDPNRGGTVRSTSDAFFSTNHNDTWDLVFIDGLHEYEQVKRDVSNAFTRLNNGGAIVIHDMLPTTENQAAPQPIEKFWLGDVWRLAFDLAQCDNLQFSIFPFDFGCGIITHGSQEPLDIAVDSTWEFYTANYERLPIKTWEEYFNASK